MTFFPLNWNNYLLELNLPELNVTSLFIVDTDQIDVYGSLTTTISFSVKRYIALPFKTRNKYTILPSALLSIFVTVVYNVYSLNPLNRIDTVDSLPSVRGYQFNDKKTPYIKISLQCSACNFRLLLNGFPCP